jgi:hypothetical protein
VDRRLVGLVVGVAGFVVLVPAMTAHADPYGDAATPPAPRSSPDMARRTPLVEAAEKALTQVR